MAPETSTDVEQVRARVDTRLAEHVAELRAELADLNGLDPVLGELEAMLAGGKRVRAALCYWSWRAHGGTPGDPVSGGTSATAEQVLRTGAALELFQSAALFHDDVMDASDTRRGRPTAHRAFAAEHRAAGWHGDPNRFGLAAAILLGDLALVASERELSAAVEVLDEGLRARVRQVFDHLRTEVTAGQYLDVLAQAVPFGSDPAADEARARTVIRAKSARYSVEHPLALGALLAGADATAVELIRSVGLPLGEAFQLRDDLLGVFGDPATTGKPAGDDLREGKRTVLVARALGAAPPADADLLRTRMGRVDLSGADVAELRGVLRRSGAVDQVERLIDDLAVPALDRLATAGLADPGATMLVRLGRLLVDRHA